ncbi:TauD/TfdA dioxygenase family protein [Crossiella cryophila]|uniref:Alpha-ketoglutarate-dependent taurine dioxygenase n=1 Tax=Crossiella cryophila TaxID=43355 RepID=A0A7W7FVZ7_9PSEU|nr:TauD/TfdA family dioxygenase [Crossiella cryophila]MBB4679058.1 alpha-ketoglutarate-dependent taurine dioxygenase [Crossiella cryophila]
MTNLALDLPGATATALDPVGLLIEPTGSGQDPRRLPVGLLRELARTHHLLLLRGFASFAGPEELAAWSETWGEIMMWPFGAVLELIEAEAPADHIFDHSYVPLHWDGMYRPYIPEFQVFHCVSAPGGGQGGATTFCDSARMLAHTSSASLERWSRVEVTYRIPNLSHYGGQAVSPLVVPHPRTGEPTMRYNEPPRADDDTFRNRPEQAFAGLPDKEVPALLTELHAATHDPRWYYEHTWQEGDLVIADNYTLLHGRTAFTHRAPRHIRRVHVLGEPPFRNPAGPDVERNESR